MGIWVHTVCKNDFLNHKQMTNQTTIVVIGALRVKFLLRKCTKTKMDGRIQFHWKTQSVSICLSFQNRLYLKEVICSQGRLFLNEVICSQGEQILPF